MKSHRRNAGFTLVELIVVLVILAVLAALLVPSLTGYIDKAREASVIAEARAVLTASQASVTEAYAKGELKADRAGGGFAKLSEYSRYTMAKQISALSEISVDNCEWRICLPGPTNTELPTAKISLFSYCNKQYYVTYRAVAWDDEPAGWSVVKRGETLPAHNDVDDPFFLKSGDYNPKLPEPPKFDQSTSGGGTSTGTGGTSGSGTSGGGTDPDGPDSPGSGSSTDPDPDVGGSGNPDLPDENDPDRG